MSFPYTSSTVIVCPELLPPSDHPVPKLFATKPVSPGAPSESVPSELLFGLQVPFEYVKPVKPVLLGVPVEPFVELGPDEFIPVDALVPTDAPLVPVLVELVVPTDEPIELVPTEPVELELYAIIIVSSFLFFNSLYQQILSQIFFLF